MDLRAIVNNEEISYDVTAEMPAHMSSEDLIFAMGVHDQDCTCPWCGEFRYRRLAEFARWIVSLDDTEGPGFEARKSVSMNQIITKAREALALPDED